MGLDSSFTFSAVRFALPPEARVYTYLFKTIGADTEWGPFVLAAICMRESRCGQELDPPGPGGTGDSGHGRGLMQIDDRTNAEWLANVHWQDPATNIRKGADLLTAKKLFFLAAPVGQVELDGESAARRNVGPGCFPDPRPLGADALLRATIASYNTGEKNVLMSLACGADIDCTTAKGSSGRPDYSADILTHVAAMRIAAVQAPPDDADWGNA